MDLHALREQVGAGFVVGAIDQREDRARGPDHRLLTLDQLPDHALGIRRAGFLFNGRKLGKLLVGTRRVDAQRADPLRDLVHGRGQFHIMRLKQIVQGRKHRPRDIPVEIVRL